MCILHQRTNPKHLVLLLDLYQSRDLFGISAHRSLLFPQTLDGGVHKPSPMSTSLEGLAFYGLFVLRSLFYRSNDLRVLR